MRSLSEKRKLQIKRLASVIPVQLRQGHAYRRWRRFINDAELYPQERMTELQLAKLQSIVRYAYDYIEGYRRLYDAARICPDDIRSLEDIRHLPFTTKQMFQNDLDSFTARVGSRRYITTGGSTGIPFGFYVSKDVLDMEKAFMHAGWERAGWKLGDRSAVLRGGFIGSAQTPIQYDPYRRELNLSTYYLTEHSLPKYLAAIKVYQPKALQAYPSALNMLADLLIESKRQKEILFDVILLGSENIYDWQLDKIQAVFPLAHIFSWYGHAEMAILAPWCETERLYHAWPFYGYTEIIGHKGREVSEGEQGELVGTSFHNLATPLIRYRTLDHAIKGKSVCSSCGRVNLTLEKITGRSHELIVTDRGRQISMTAINMHSNVFDNVQQFQFYQEKMGEVIFRIVRKSTFTEADSEYIRNELLKKLGDDFNLVILPVDEIPRTESGKYRFLVQMMPVSAGDKNE